jgi:DNA-binding MarR family transcriptional regulator
MDPRVERLVPLSLAVHYLNKTSEALLGISLVQYRFLVSLRSTPGISPQGLAAAICMHPSTVTQILKRLNGKGAIFVDLDPRDSRRKMLGLTRTGFKLILEFERHIPEILDGDSFLERIQSLGIAGYPLWSRD